MTKVNNCLKFYVNTRPIQKETRFYKKLGATESESFSDSCHITL